MKNKWLFLCFGRKKSLNLKHSTTESERNILHQKTSIPLPIDQKKKIDPCPDDINDRRKSPRRRRFCRVFYGVFSNAASALAKKKRNKGSGKEASSNHHHSSASSSSSSSSEFQKIFNTWNEKKSNSLLSAAESLSLLYSQSLLFPSWTWDSPRSSSSSSSYNPIVTTSRNTSRVKQTTPCLRKTISIPRQKEEKMGKCWSKGERVGLYVMVVISLVGLVLLGEALAVLSTSIFLFLFSFIHGGMMVMTPLTFTVREYLKGMPPKNHRIHIY